MKDLKDFKTLHQRLQICRKCPNVCGTPVHGPAMKTKVMLIGQAPGIHEAVLGRPFAHTAGKTLFKWLEESFGANEAEVREMIYFSAVARCFPGKAKSGQGDRAPSKEEVENCREHLESEMKLIKPEVIIAVGKVAISEVLKEGGITPTTPLEDLVGKVFKTRFHGKSVQVIPLPHPSGVSRWPHSPTGKLKLRAALKALREVIADKL